MPPIKDIFGQRFGRLLVKEFAFIGKNRKAYWHCICDCGKEIDAVYHTLKISKTMSCGCIARENSRQRMMKPEGDSAKNSLFCTYRKTARVRELEFSLTLEEFIDITSLRCHYCDRSPSSYVKTEKSNGSYCYNGIDRVNKLLGYTKENSVPCCKQCNYRKKANTKEEFIAHTMRIAHHQQRIEMTERMKEVRGKWWGGFEINKIEDSKSIEASFGWI